MKIKKLSQLIEAADTQSISIAKVVLHHEAEESGRTEEAIVNEMSRRIDIMSEALAQGTENPLTSKSGLIKGGGYLMAKAAADEQTIIGGLFSQVVANALAVAEVNACMGRIVAAPTAGSCGVLPGTLITVARHRGISDEVLLDGFLTAAGIGMAVEYQATLSGAEGGCQAECGAASAMAAGALVEMMGGSPRSVGDAVSFAMKSTLGLICDPVAGLVEIPCVKRNVSGAINAIAAAEMALAGIESVVPVDEIIAAMGEVGRRLPAEFRETGKGGVAACPTAKAFSKEYL